MSYHQKNTAKYKAKKTEVDGIIFDSKAEAERYTELKALEEQGQIADLRMQVKFLLIPAQKRKDGKTERSCSYIADFCYWANDEYIVEDVKGYPTDAYIIKRKLMLLKGYQITELKK